MAPVDLPLSTITGGRVVVLNGPSSVGKTSVAHALRALEGPQFVVVSLDHFLPCVHPERQHDWSLFEALTRALCASAVSFARSGFHVVVDTVFERPACFDICVESFAGIATSWVGLVCPVEVLEQRERARGDRPLGLTRRQSLHVHDGPLYNLTLDTAQESVTGCAREISRATRG